MKNIKINPVYVVLAVLALVAFRSPEDQRIVNSTERTITVTGSADMMVPPDEISIDISYREYWHNRTLKSKATISQIEKKIIKAANDAGVPTTAIAVNSAAAWKHHWNYWYYWYDYHNYMNQKNLTIKVKSSKQLNQVIKNLKANDIKRDGITNIQLNGSSNKKIQEYRKMVKERAMQAAQEKADYLLEAVGQKRGVVVTITELDDPTSKTTTTTHGGYYHPYWGYPYLGGYGGSTTINNGGANAISNSSVSMPSSGSGSVGAQGKDDLSMKPIRLRYEIQAQFTIVPM